MIHLAYFSALEIINVTIAFRILINSVVYAEGVPPNMGIQICDDDALIAGVSIMKALL